MPQRQIGGPVCFRTARLRTGHVADRFDFLFGNIPADYEPAELVKQSCRPKRGVGGKRRKLQRQFVARKTIQLPQQRQCVGIVGARRLRRNNCSPFVHQRLNKQCEIRVRRLRRISLLLHGCSL